MTQRPHVVLGACLVSSMAWGAGFDPYDVKNNFEATPQEQQMCQAVIYQGRDTSDHANWAHMHHFCDCVRFVNRSYTTMSNPTVSNFDLQRAVKGCDYVLDHTTPDFYMLPEVHLQKGKALRLLKQDAKAAGEFAAAIQGNPRLAPAYIALSDMEADRGNKKAALQFVTDGLRYVPESKPLQRRYKDLGGTLPFPSSVAVKEAPPVQPKSPRAPVQSGGASDTPTAASDKPVAGTASGMPPQPKAGSSTNP